VASFGAEVTQHFKPKALLKRVQADMLDTLAQVDLKALKQG
jgi:hypothetical protein